MANTDKMIQWFQNRKGKVTYSMARRNGPNSYDCSSSVYYAMIEAGILPKGTYIGNTESLYKLEGKVLEPITRSQARKGDIFIAGKKGASGGSFGHTGVFVSNSQIIHCNGRDNGISQTGVEGRTGNPVYFFRIKGTGAPIADKNVKTVKVSSKATHWAEPNRTAIPSFVKGGSYDILETKNTKQGNSTKAYLIGKGSTPTGWLLEQDVEGFRPNTGTSTTVPPTSARSYSNNVRGYQQWLNDTYGYKIAVDNDWGNDTKKHSIMALQKEWGIVSDGEFGKNSKAAAKNNNIKKGDKGNDVGIVQGFLMSKGYNVNGFDRKYGDGLEKAIKQYQKSVGETQDGVIGSGTYTKMFG